MRARFPARLRRDRRGVSAVEFGIVAPVLCLLLAGAFDVAHTLYLRATLQGIMQKAARDSALESGTDAQVAASIDNKVRRQVAALVNNAGITFSRRFYRTFTDAAAADPEAWTDTNHNNTCDNHEPYQDDNNNSVWDRDGGDSGQGTAKDRTVYTVTVTYNHMFPLYRFLGQSNATSMSATTVLENQPYSDQASYAAATVRYC